MVYRVHLFVIRELGDGGGCSSSGDAWRVGCAASCCGEVVVRWSWRAGGMVSPVATVVLLLPPRHVCGAGTSSTRDYSSSFF